MKQPNIYISDCGGFVAIRVPTPVQPTYDIWRHDGSEMWEGTRYVQVPDAPSGQYLPQRTYMEEHAQVNRCVPRWSKLENGFEVTLLNIYTNERIDVTFHTSAKSLSPTFSKRRKSATKPRKTSQ